MADTLVSVVIIGYNQGAWLAHAIESVLGQTYRNIELIIVDNGSTDDSREIARRYGDRPNVRLLLHEDGATVTRRCNEGIAASSGDFISFLYADDWYLPNKIELEMKAFAELPEDYGVVYAPMYRRNVDSDAQWLMAFPNWSGWVLESMLHDYHRRWLDTATPLARRECYLRYPFHEDLFQEGETIYLRIAISYRFHPLTEPLIVMREHRGNLGKAYELQALLNLVLLKRLESEQGFPRRLVPTVERIRARTMRNLGWSMVRLASDPVKGRSYLAKSLDWGLAGAVHPRFAVGMVMSALPRPVLRLVNRVANRLRRHRHRLDVNTQALGAGSEISSVPTA